MPFYTKSEIDEKKRKEAEKEEIAKMSPTKRLRMVYSEEKPARGELVIPPGIEKFPDWVQELERHRIRMAELSQVKSLTARLKEVHTYDHNRQKIIDSFNKSQ